MIKNEMKKLTDYIWKGDKNAFDNENYCRLSCENADSLAEVFPEDTLLSDEDNPYDKYLHVYYDVDNDKIIVLKVGYEHCTWEDDVILDITDEEKSYLESIVQELWNQEIISLKTSFSADEIISDIHTIIRKEGKNEIRYPLPKEEMLIIEVLRSDYDLKIAVEKLDGYGDIVKCVIDDYNCNDERLIAMIINVLSLEDTTME